MTTSELRIDTTGGPAAAAWRSPFPLTFYGIRESRPGPEWRALFDTTWPAYRRWYLSDGATARPSVATGLRKLRGHMPELVPTWERLVELADDETAAAMLTLWSPPAVLPGCSQAVLIEDEPLLVRNYDFRPDMFERVVMSTQLEGRRVIGSSDCLWGLVDGMNDAGLAVSIALGGRRKVAEGFGIPLVVRYLLEVCATRGDVRNALHGMPVAMAYNVTVVDASGDAATFFVSPEERPEEYDARVATNHRGRVPEDPLHAARVHSVERKDYLERALEHRLDQEGLIRAFLRAPLYNDRYAHGFGTLYTAAYRPTRGVVDYLWPTSTWRRDYDSPSGSHEAVLGVRPRDTHPGWLVK